MSERKAPDRVWIGPVEHDGEWVWNDHPWDDEGLTEYVRAAPSPAPAGGGAPSVDVLKDLQDDLEMALERVRCLRAASPGPTGTAGEPSEPEPSLLALRGAAPDLEYPDGDPFASDDADPAAAGAAPADGPTRQRIEEILSQHAGKHITRKAAADAILRIAGASPASPAVREAAAFAAEEMERIAAWVDHRDAALQLREAAASVRATLAAEGEPAGPTE